MAILRCVEAVVKALEMEGIRYVFGHPGHGNTNILGNYSACSFVLPTRRRNINGHPS
jgi:thiamine pyrophosphate-dependent acetolactate synthase large subunit-like protein